MNKKLLSLFSKDLAIIADSRTFAVEKDKNGRERNRSLLHFL